MTTQRTYTPVKPSSLPKKEKKENGLKFEKKKPLSEGKYKANVKTKFNNSKPKKSPPSPKVSDLNKSIERLCEGFDTKYSPMAHAFKVALSK